MQCDPRVLTSSEIEQLTTNDDYKKFLAKATNRFTRCMQQNVVSDIFNDPFGRLFDEELGIEKGNASVLQVGGLFADLPHHGVSKLNQSHSRNSNRSRISSSARTGPSPVLSGIPNSRVGGVFDVSTRMTFTHFF